MQTARSSFGNTHQGWQVPGRTFAGLPNQTKMTASWPMNGRQISSRQHIRPNFVQVNQSGCAASEQVTCRVHGQQGSWMLTVNTMHGLQRRHLGQLRHRAESQDRAHVEFSKSLQKALEQCRLKIARKKPQQVLHPCEDRPFCFEGERDYASSVSRSQNNWTTT